MSRQRGGSGASGRIAALSLAALFALAPVAAQPRAPQGVAPGFVDGSRFVELVGEQHLRLEVSISGVVLRALTRIDPELYQLAGGLESIHAVVLDLKDPKLVTRARRQIGDVQRELSTRGWERVALVREDETEIHVLVLGRDETIRGLVVMIVNADEAEPQLVFANVAGVVDLAAIQRIGEGFNVPGLRDLEVE